MSSRASGYVPPKPKNGYEFTEGSGYTLPEYPFVAPADLGAEQLKRYSVVVVGAGISGLTLACSMASLGVPCIVLDEDNTVGVKGASSRGICYAQKTLEIFKRMGLYERIAAKGVQWSVGRTFAGLDEVYRFDLRDQGSHSLSLEPPFINIQQFYVEGFLVERLAELGKTDVRWRSRVVAYEPNDGFVTLTVDTPDGQYQCEALYVVDATGAHSPFRNWLEVDVSAKKGDDRWCIADVRFATQPALERHTWIEAPFNENRAVWQHLMADDVWRLDYQMAPNCDMAAVSREDVVRERLRRQFGDDVDCSVVWVGPYAYRSECLSKFRYGHVFFMGDAAHVVSPFGARGGNSGVHDADNLAWKLAAVLRGEAVPALLYTYDVERRAAALNNVQVTGRTARYLRAPEGVERLFRNATIALAKQYPFARQLVNTGRMSTPNTYERSAACSAGGGLSLQNVAFAWLDGSAGQMIDLLRWARGRLLLLVFGTLDELTLERLHALASVAAVRMVHVVQPGAAQAVLETLVDVHGHVALATRGVDSYVETPTGLELGFALVRPDAYLAASGAGINSAVVDAVGRALGMSAGITDHAHESFDLSL